MIWQPGPARGFDPVANDEVFCGDRFLIAVLATKSGVPFLATEVIVATEGGFDTPDGESWSSWLWSDVEWFIKLDKANLPQ